MRPFRTHIERALLLFAFVSLSGCVTLPGWIVVKKAPEEPPPEENVRFEEPWADEEDYQPAPLTKRPSGPVTPQEENELYQLVTQDEYPKKKPAPKRTAFDFPSAPKDDTILPPPPKMARSGRSAPTPAHVAHLDEIPRVRKPRESLVLDDEAPGEIPLAIEGAALTEPPLPRLEDPKALAEATIHQISASSATDPERGGGVRRAYDVPDDIQLTPSARTLLESQAKQLEDAIRHRDKLLETATREIRAATTEVREARREMRDWTEDIKQVEERIKQREQEYLRTLRSLVEPLEQAAAREEAKKPIWRARTSK